MLKLRTTLLSALALVLVLLGIFIYMQERTRSQVQQEVHQQQLENYQDTRERIDDALKEDPAVDDPVAAAREWLQQRGSSHPGK